MHVMINLETLGTRPNAVVIQIGAVLFEPVSGGKVLNGKAFDRHVLVQDGSGTIDHGTLCFWLAEKSAARMGKALSERAVFLGRALEELVAWPMETHGLSWEAVEGVWAKPADFDLPILKSAFAQFGMDVPWDRRTTRCVNTLFSLVGGTPEVDWTGLIHHDARDDAVGQAMQVQKAMAALHK